MNSERYAKRVDLEKCCRSKHSVTSSKKSASIQQNIFKKSLGTSNQHANLSLSPPTPGTNFKTLVNPGRRDLRGRFSESYDVALRDLLFNCRRVGGMNVCVCVNE